MPQTPQATRSGPPKLSEIARKVSAPLGAVATGWPAIEKTCRQKMGITFDPWQSQVGGLILAKRADGSLASTIDGVGMSLPRQVGKTYLIASLTFALCINNPGLLVIWTAHHMATGSETFLALQGFAERAKVKPHVRQVFTGSGDEEVRFHNGSRILFGARERGFGRGVPGVDVLIFDEAQILSDKAMSNMLATMNTSSLGLHIYVGTPPKPEDMSEAFSQMRAQAYAGTLVDGAWVEFGADPDTDPDDRSQWRKMNPSYPHRTPAQSIRRLQRKLTPADFDREGRGIWDDDGAKTWQVIAKQQWSDLAVPPEGAPADGNLAFGVKFSADGSRYGVAVALATEHGVHVEALPPVPMAQGLSPLADWLAERWRDASAIVLDGKAGTGDLHALLRARKVSPRRVQVLNTPDAITAHSSLLRMINEGTLTHLDQPGLTKATSVAGKRKIGTAGGWGWEPTTPDGDVTPLDAVTLAAHGAVTTRQRRRSGTGEAVIA